ncbi:MAG: hypothetical protein ACJ8EV_03525 [Sphingomicrobium sp.]
MKGIAAITLIVAACSQQAERPGENAVQPEAQVATNVAAPTGQPTIAAPLPSVPPPAPTRTSDAEKSPEAAAKVLHAYFAAIAAKRYADAYRMWGNDGQAAGRSMKQFADSFARYRTYHGLVGSPGQIEGAAGSVYIQFPVKVTGMLAQGGGFVLEGPMTLRRVNDVAGSTTEQRRWHVESSGLRPGP